MEKNTADRIRIVAAQEVDDDVIDTVFGVRGEAARCQCQWFRMRGRDFEAASVDELRALHHEQTACGTASPVATSGLIAFLGDEPAGWCAVAPRAHYPRLRAATVPWKGRAEDPADDTVWAVTCFVTRPGFRRRGVAAALAFAAPDFARDRGARAIEAYPLTDDPARVDAWGQLYVGVESIFERAGFVRVTHPTPRRVVVRRELPGADASTPVAE